MLWKSIRRESCLGSFLAGLLLLLVISSRSQGLDVDVETWLQMLEAKNVKLGPCIGAGGLCWVNPLVASRGKVFVVDCSSCPYL